MQSPPRKQSSIRKAGRIVLWLLALVLVLAGLGVGWLASDVRSLPFLRPYVQRAVSVALSPLQVEAEEIRYTVDLGKRSLVTGLSDVTLRDAAGHRVAVLSRVNLDLGLLSLLSGTIRFSTLEVVKPSIRLIAQPDGRLTMSVTPQEQEVPLAEEGVPPLQLSDLIVPLKQLAVRTVVVRDAFLNILSEKGAATYRLPRVVLLTEEQGDLFSLQYDVKLREAEAKKSSRLTGSLEMNLAQNTLALRAALDRFNLALLAPFHPYAAPLAGSELRLNGSLELAAHADGTIAKVAADLHADSEATIAHPEWFPEPLVFEVMRLKGTMGEDKILHLEEVALENKDMKLAASGDATYSEAGPGVRATVTLEEVPIDRIGAYWPQPLSPDSRDWVTKYLTVGMVEKATATVAFTPEDLVAEHTPAGILDARIKVANATVEYLPGYPKISGVNGDVKIDAQGLKVKASSGMMLSGAKVAAAEFAIPDFAAAGVPMETTVALSAPAKDVAEMIGPKRLNLASALKLDPAKITGDAQGKLTLALPLYSAGWPKDKPYITYDIEAELKDVAQSGILDKWDISGMNGTVKVDNVGLTLDTKTNLQGLPAALKVERSFAGKEKTAYTLVADIPREKMPVFGFEMPDQVQGTLGVKARVEEEGTQSTTTAQVDLAQAVIRIPDLHYEKKQGEAAVLSLKQEGGEQFNIVPEFSYRAANAEVNGSYTQDKKSGELTVLHLSRFVLGQNNLVVDYAVKEGRKFVSLSGKTLDLSSPEKPEQKKEEQAQPEKVPATEEKNPLDIFMNMRLDLALESLLLSKGHGFDGMKGHVDCGVSLCHSAHVTAFTGSNRTPFTFAIDQTAEGRKLTMTSQDAGGVIKALDISDHVIGGDLGFSGVFDDQAARHPLKGKLNIRDFRVVKAPILAKLLSLASLTGFLDALSGNGISFSKLSAEMRYTDGRLKVSKGKAYGSAVGLTAEGSIAPFAGTINLKGTVVPAYTANSILGHIPLLGHILTGGEGGGIIAANYSMKGESDDPSIMVNPLSLLTPGFLRNLFDVFDAPQEKEPEKEKKGKVD